MAERVTPIMDGPGSPQEEQARRDAAAKRDALKMDAKLRAEFLKNERERKRKGLK